MSRASSSSRKPSSPHTPLPNAVNSTQSTPVQQQSEQAAPWQTITQTVRFRSQVNVEPAPHPKMQVEEDEEESDSSDESSENPRCVLALYASGFKLAAAYLDPRTDILHVMEDLVDSPEWDIIGLILDQIKPDTILVNSSAEESLIEMSKTFADQLEAGRIVEVRPQKDFAFAKSKNRLLTVRLPPSPSELEAAASTSSTSARTVSSVQNDAYSFSRRSSRLDLYEALDDDVRARMAELRLGTMLDFDKTFAISACGGLLVYLARLKAAGDLGDDDHDGGLEFSGIEIFVPSAYMLINADALSSLQIFDSEAHAYGSGVSKEGLSLFGILDTTRTPLGRFLLRTWLLRPLVSIKDICARHDAVGLFSRGENHLPAEHLKGLLKGMANVSRVLMAMRRGRAGLRDFKALLEFTYRVLQIRDGAEELIGPYAAQMMQKLSAALDAEVLSAHGFQINHTIDWEQSIIEGRVCCKEGIDAELDEWKRMYAGLDTLLAQIAANLSREVPPAVISELNVTYFPQLGFLIAAVMARPWEEENHEADVLPGWQFQFLTESTVYFKNDKMRDLDAHFGDIHSNIADREIEIVQKLSESVVLQAARVQRAVETCSELDCFLAFADVARHHNYRRPFMTEENVLKIKNGRHPLQELTVDHYVPNSTVIYGGEGNKTDINEMDADEKRDLDESDEDASRQRRSVMVLSGSNASGKSVYAKGVALIVYMAQIGCFVPCDAATIGTCDKIFTRIASRETVAKAQSSFMIDLSQISFALRNATPRSLILADEFGKGTISTDGAGLLAGVILHLLNRGAACPKTIVVTHFHELFSQGFVSPDLPIAFASMDIIVPPVSETPIAPPPVTYLYKLIPTLSLTSHALACARSQGVPIELCTRAEEVRRYLSAFEFLPLQDRALSDKQKQELKEAEATCRRFLQWRIPDDEEAEDGMEVEDVREVLRGFLESEAEMIVQQLDEEMDEDE